MTTTTAERARPPGIYEVVRGSMKGQEFDLECSDVEAWGDKWMWVEGNPTCLAYAVRCSDEDIGLGGKVFYGKLVVEVDGREMRGGGILLHESELGERLRDSNQPSARLREAAAKATVAP